MIEVAIFSGFAMPPGAIIGAPRWPALRSATVTADARHVRMLGQERLAIFVLPEGWEVSAWPENLDPIPPFVGDFHGGLPLWIVREGDAPWTIAFRTPRQVRNWA